MNKVGYFLELCFQKSSGRQCWGPQSQPTGPQGTSVTFNRNRLCTWAALKPTSDHCALKRDPWAKEQACRCQCVGEKGTDSYGRGRSKAHGLLCFNGKKVSYDVAFAPKNEASLWVWIASPNLANTHWEPACFPAPQPPSLKSLLISQHPLALSWPEPGQAAQENPR